MDLTRKKLSEKIKKNWNLGEYRKKIFLENKLSKKKGEKNEAIYQLKKTSDCSQNDPPGLKQKLSKNQRFLNIFGRTI